MKIKITFLSLLFAAQLNAQTITYPNFSASLTSTLPAVLANTSSFNLSLNTTIGNGVTWDASALTQQPGIPTLHLIYGNPSSTPNGSLFSGSNYVQYDPALTSIISYNYFNYGADSVVKIGSYDPSTAHEIYSNPDKHLEFPFAYGQSFTDTYAKTNYSDATTVSSFQTGSRTVTFNGYGTLILPQGTFTNVALVSELRTNNLGPNSSLFTWYDISNGKQLMFYEENAGTTTIAYTTDLSTGLNQQTIFLTPSISPNPFKDNAILIISNSAQVKKGTLNMMDVLGNVLKSYEVNTNQISISREGINNGIYFYQIINNNEIISSGKMIIE